MMPTPAEAFTPPFDQVLRSEDRDEWTTRVAAPVPHVRPKTESALLFRLGAEWFGLGTHLVASIAPVPVTHSLPTPRSGIAIHLVNVEGDLLVAVALGALIGVATTPDVAQRSTARMVVTNAKVAFLVDEVFGVHRYHDEELRPIPATLAATMGARTVGLLDWGRACVARFDDEAIMRAIGEALG
ncbi:MAG: chemotaxis protein CheW [Gemmatimonadales bacterium]